jgi:hypothetical protein
VSTSLVVSDILGDRVKGCHRSVRNANKADEEAVWLLAERIASEVDALAGSVVMETGATPAADGACCACSKPSQEGKLEIKGKPVAIPGLPLIFQQLQKKGLKPVGDYAHTLVKTVSVYHYIDAHEEPDYRDALAKAYRVHCER